MVGLCMTAFQGSRKVKYKTGGQRIPILFMFLARCSEALKDMLGSFRQISKSLGQKLSTENSSAGHIFASKFRKEKMRLLAILLRTAREVLCKIFFLSLSTLGHHFIMDFFHYPLWQLKTASACPTLFKTVTEEKSRESRYENTLRYVQALTDNIQRLEKAVEAEKVSRATEEVLYIFSWKG